jgi:ubiquinone/menaquinone biosynthesis C-methylase UbiE
VQYTAVEPNLFMHKTIEERSSVLEKQNPVLTTLNDVPSSSQDVVISTLVLCSVDNQDEAIGQIMRVLKPGGKLLFLEHVIEIDQGYPAPYNIDIFDWGRATYRWAQQALSPLQVRVELQPQLVDENSPAHVLVWLVRKLTCPRFLCNTGGPGGWVPSGEGHHGDDKSGVYRRFLQAL